MRPSTYISAAAVASVVGLVILGNYVYFRAELARVKDECASAKAAADADTELKAFDDLAAEYARVNAADLPPATEGRLGVAEIRGFGYLLADATGDWVLFLHHSPCPFEEVATLEVGLFSQEYTVTSGGLNINLAQTRDGAIYRNDEHLCMFLIPNVATVAEFPEYARRLGTWRRLDSPPTQGRIRK